MMTICLSTLLPHVVTLCSGSPSAAGEEGLRQLQTNATLNANCLQEKRTHFPDNSNKIPREDFDWPAWIM